jgi:hypothetical protein
MTKTPLPISTLHSLSNTFPTFIHSFHPKPHNVTPTSFSDKNPSGTKKTFFKILQNTKRRNKPKKPKNPKKDTKGFHPTTPFPLVSVDCGIDHCLVGFILEWFFLLMATKDVLKTFLVEFQDQTVNLRKKYDK